MKKSYEYLLFDWDGTIVQTLDMWLHIKRTVTKQYGKDIPQQEIIDSFGNFAHYCRDVWQFDNPDRVVADVFDQARQQVSTCPTYPGARATITRLHKHAKKMALITASPRKNLSVLLQGLKLDHFFDIIIVTEELKHHKPHPEPLERAFAGLGGTDRSQAIMIGDGDKDLGAAQAFGCDSLLFYPSQNEKFYNIDKLNTYNPTYKVTRFDDIFSIVS